MVPDNMDRSESLIRLKQLLTAPERPEDVVRNEVHAKCMSHLSVLAVLKDELDLNYNTTAHNAASDILLKRLLLATTLDDRLNCLRELMSLFRRSQGAAEATLKAVALVMELEVKQIKSELEIQSGQVDELKQSVSEVARLRVQCNTLSTALDKIDALSNTRVCLPLPRRLIVNRNKLFAAPVIPTGAIKAVYSSAASDHRPFAQVALDVFTTDYFHGDRHLAEKALREAFSNETVRALSGACELGEFIPRPILTRCLDLLKDLTNESGRVNVGNLLVRLGDELDLNRNGSTDITRILIDAVASESHDELLAWSEAIKFTMRSDAMLNLFIRNILKSDKCHASELKERVAVLSWLDSIWEPELVDEDGLVDVDRLKSSLSCDMSLDYADLILPVSRVIKLVRLNELHDMGKSFAKHIEGAAYEYGLRLNVRDIMTICPTASEVQALEILDAISDMADCLQLDTSEISEHLFVTAALMVGI